MKIYIDEAAGVPDDAFQIVEARMKYPQQIGRSIRMKAVSRIETPKYETIIGCCATEVRHLGTLGYCKKHSPFLTPQHMGWVRFSYHWLRTTGTMIGASVMPLIIKVLVVAAFILIFFQAVLTGIDKQELVACYQHQTYSQTLAGYEVSEEAAKRCDALGVSVYAVVN